MRQSYSISLPAYFQLLCGQTFLFHSTNYFLNVACEVITTAEQEGSGLQD